MTPVTIEDACAHPLRVGIGGPVGSGKTALVEALCKRLRDDYDIYVITNDIYKVVRAIDGVKDVDIDIVWEPYWTPERIDPKIRAMMGF